MLLALVAFGVLALLFGAELRDLDPRSRRGSWR
jgi:hypothetical protein